MTKILIVDDEIKIREVVKEYAKASNFECSEASNGKEAIELSKKNDFDCIILDIMMPEIDGYETLTQIKKDKDVPIIMLSARQEEDDKLYCFELGADDYVTKPFSPKELMARIKAITSRKNPKKNKVFTYKTLVVNTEAHTIKIDNKEINITPKEFDLMAYFIKNQNIALSRDKLLENVWNDYSFEDSRTVDTHVKMLRKNLGKYRDTIKTVRGIGYKFEV